MADEDRNDDIDRYRREIPLSGYYGEQFFASKPSKELADKEEARANKRTKNDETIAKIENGLCRKYNVPIPKKYPNRRQDRGEGGEQLLILGSTCNDRRNPKLWGIRQEDRTRHLMLLGPSGSGKPVTIYTNVLSEYGWKKIGEISVGDKVYNRNGVLAPVSGVFPQGKKDVWEIELADGQIIECGKEHLWTVLREQHGEKKEKVVTTFEMFESYYSSDSNDTNYKKPFFIVRPDPIDFPKADLSVDPYVLGCLLGDGYIASKTNSVFMSSADKELIDRMSERLGDNYIIEKYDKESYSWVVKERWDDGKIHATAKKLRNKLRTLDVCYKSENKKIPKEYLWGSIEQRRDLLKGLMDTDGCASKGRISFATISEQMKDDFLYLVRSLGYEAHVRVDARENKYPNSGKCYNISILGNDVENIFYLSRKIRSYREYKSNRKNTIKRIPREKSIDYGNRTVHSEELPIPSKEYGNLILSKKRTLLREHPEILNTSFYQNYSGNNFDMRYVYSDIETRMEFLRSFVSNHMHVCGRKLERSIKNDAIRASIKKNFESCGYRCETKQYRDDINMLFVVNPDLDLVTDKKMIEKLRGNGALDEFNQKRSNKYQGIRIVDIRKTNRREEMVCISVNDDTHTYLIDNFVVTHNSTLLHALGVEDMWYWRGGLLMEPHGDLALSLLMTAPPYRIHNIIYLNVLDPFASPGFNPLEVPIDADDNQRQKAVGEVTTMLAKHFNIETGNVKILRMLRNAVNALAWVPGATLLEVMDFYNNEDIRNTVLSFVPDGPKKDVMITTAENIKIDDLGPLQNRFDQFTTNNAMKHLFGQAHETFDFFELMNKGYYIICPASKGGTSDSFFLKFYGSYIVSQVYKSALMRESIKEDNRVNFSMTLDEFQNFLSGDIEGILAEARKYGLQMTLANQYLSQLKQSGGDIKGAVLQNCATKLSYNLASDDAPTMSKSIGGGITASDMQAIPKYHVMAAPLVRGGNVKPFISAVFPPISLKSEVSGITAELIRENTRQRFMTPRDKIDKEIAERKEALASGNKEAVVKLYERICREHDG